MKIEHLLFWGFFGLVAEIFFTALVNLISKKDFNLTGHTSLWMFPIYALGLTYGFDFVQQHIRSSPCEHEMVILMHHYRSAEQGRKERYSLY